MILNGALYFIVLHFTEIFRRHSLLRSGNALKNLFSAHVPKNAAKTCIVFAVQLCLAIRYSFCRTTKRLKESPHCTLKKKMCMAQCNKGARFTLVLVGQLIQGNGLPYAVAWQTCTKSFFFKKVPVSMGP